MSVSAVCISDSCTLLLCWTPYSACNSALSHTDCVHLAESNLVFHLGRLKDRTPSQKLSATCRISRWPFVDIVNEGKAPARKPLRPASACREPKGSACLEGTTVSKSKE